MHPCVPSEHDEIGVPEPLRIIGDKDHCWPHPEDADFLGFVTAARAGSRRRQTAVSGCDNISRRAAQYLGNSASHLGDLERLRQQGNARDSTGAESLRITGYEQYLEARLRALCPLYDRRTIHFRHGIIHEEQVDWPLSF